MYKEQTSQGLQVLLRYMQRTQEIMAKFEKKEMKGKKNAAHEKKESKAFEKKEHSKHESKESKKKERLEHLKGKEKKGK